MKLSKSFWQTYKEIPHDAEIVSHQLLLRAGLIFKTGAGIYSYLPMATKVIRKIENIIRDELNKIGAQELIMSFVTPAELWKDSGRWEDMGPEMLRIKDRKDNDFCLSPTNEETVTDIFRKTVSSYKSLPVNLYQINTKFRDEIRPRFGLMRGKEFTMKDAYSFHFDKTCFDKTYEDYYQAYSNIFKRMGLEFIIVEADGGAMAASGSKTHEFQVVADSGEDVVVEAKSLGYAANIEKAVTYRANLTSKEACELKEIETKNLQTCQDVCDFLKIPVYQSLKTLLMTALYGQKEVHYMVMLLGDDELNEIKLKNFLKADHIAAAKDTILSDLGVPKGYMSPLGLNGKVNVLFDAAIDLEKSYVVGANKENYHAEGFVPARDVEKYKSSDFRLAKEGDVAHDRKTPVHFRKGIEVGHIFQLGDKYTKSMQATVLDQNGKNLIPLMGCYGIGVTRTMAAAIEQNHDENGIIWPAPIAPFDVYFAMIGKNADTKKLAEEIYQDLIKANIEVLYDDRGMGPGPMFKDADLLGLPIRIVLGERDYLESGELEVKVRKTGDVLKVKKDNIIQEVKVILAKLGKH
jgi:prolyl-tRNA synthetase